MRAVFDVFNRTHARPSGTDVTVVAWGISAHPQGVRRARLALSQRFIDISMIGCASGPWCRGTRPGHGLMVRRPTDSATWGDCHLLHVGDGLTSRFAAGLAGIRQLPVLTTSDAKGFSRSGGIAEFYLEGGQMRFVINLDAAERSGLLLSSRLLGLATVIRDRDARPDSR